MRIRLAFMGRGYHRAESLPDSISLADTATIDDAIRAIESSLDGGSLPASCLIAVAGEHLGSVGNHAQRVLRDGDELTLIAPVAGG